MKKHWLQVPCQIKTNTNSVLEQGEFAGYASVFHVKDSYQDIMMPGAFSSWIQRQCTMQPVRLLWQHRSEEPIGLCHSFEEDRHGLYVKGQLLLDIQRAQEAYSLMRHQAITGLSIGYQVVSYDTDHTQNARLLTGIEIVEISIVTFPANPAAQVSWVKQSAARRGVG